MLWITLFVISNFWTLSKGQINGNRTQRETNEIVETCRCMKYWQCISERGFVYSSCGLVNICCLFGEKTAADRDEEFFYRRLIKKKLPIANSIKPKKQNKKTKKARSRDLKEILNNQLTGQSRSSRRKPNNNRNNQNSLFCCRQGDKGELYHWHADILEKKQNLYVCGGSLIRNDYILTAGHCFHSIASRNASVLKVRLGDYDISRDDELDLPYEEVSVKKILIHPKFSPETLDNDIALLQLTKKVKTNPIIEKICLPTAEMLKSIELNLEKANCFVIGHGKLNETSKNYSLTVKQIKVPLWSQKKCETSLRQLFGLNIPSMSSILCAGGINKDACIGDGGSSLTCSFDSRFYQIGIVSFGVGCGRSNNIPGVYSSLVGNINWIRQNIN